MHVNPLMQRASQESRPRDAFLKPATMRWAALFSADVFGLPLAVGLAFMVHMAVELPPLNRAVQQIAIQGFNWHG